MHVISNKILIGSILVLFNVAVFAQQEITETISKSLNEIGKEKKELKEIFVKPSGEFVIQNVIKMNLLIPGTGNVIYSAGAKKESKIMRGIALASGIWSLYNTINYASQYFDHDNSTPTPHRTRLFLLSYIVGNILNYKRLTIYNKKIADKARIEFNNGYKDGYMYVGFVYHF